MEQRNARKIKFLQEELNQENFLKTDIVLPVMSLNKLQSSPYFKMAEETFIKLGGKNFALPEDIDYHLQYQNLLIQFDDELHFNRYRKISLESELYTDYKGFKHIDYKTNSRLNEKDCIKGGLTRSIWDNSEGRKIFGPSGETGDLSLERNGASGWKLRAWTDFVQDLSGQVLGFKVLRISIYDKIMLKGQIISFGSLFTTSNRSNFGYATKSIIRRIINLKGS